MPGKAQIEIRAEGSKGIIKISGVINETAKMLFDLDVEGLFAQGCKDLDLYLDTPGGNVFYANSMGNTLKRFPGKKTAYFGALVASAGTYIALQCERRVAPRNGSGMIHQPESELRGTAKAISADLKSVQNLTNQYRKTYAEAFDMSEDEIEQLWVNNYWMNAEEMLSLGLATEISDAITISAEQQAEITALAKTTKAQVEPTERSHNISKNKMEKLPLILAALSLPETGTEVDVLAKVREITKTNGELKAKNQELEEKIKADLNTRVTALVSGAKKAGKITENQVERYTKLATANYEDTAAILDDMPVHQPVTSRLNGGANVGGAADIYAGWTMSKFRKEAPQVLAKMKTEDPDRYNELLQDYRAEVNQNANRD